MIIETVTLSLVLSILKICSGTISALGLVFGVFKVINWLKSTFTRIDSNVVELKNSMNSHITGLREDIKSQTTTIATALSEQRQDFRTFYGPAMMMQFQTQLQQNAAPMRAKRVIKKKK